MAAIKSGLALKPARPSAHRGARLRWQLGRLGRRLGWGAGAGLLGLTLALLAALQGAALERRQLALAGRLQTAAQSAAPAEPEPDQDARQLAAFYAYLPAHDAIPDQLKELVRVAGQSGVTLAKAEYKAQPETQAAFLRYQITLPVKADYAAVQSFIVNALQGLPTLTLDAVTFQREQIEAGEVEARIQFILLVKKAGVSR
ncbi:MAG: hypothetical protein V4754_16715 [Pseudomonadota bacterium]